MKDEINLPLALQDFIPVAIFAVGLFFVAKTVWQKNKTAGKLAFLGGVLVTLGGLFKASWKIVQALGGSDLPLLNNSLFVLMSAGFICLAWAFWKRFSGETGFSKILLIPAVLIGLVWSIAAYFAFLAESRACFFILLGATTLGNLALLFQLIFNSVKNGLWLALGLFLVNFVIIFVLTRTSDQTVTLQWFKQILNTFSQTAFALAAYLLWQNESRRELK